MLAGSIAIMDNSINGLNSNTAKTDNVNDSSNNKNDDEPVQQRHSLLAHDMDLFDPSSLEESDDWNDVFDDNDDGDESKSSSSKQAARPAPSRNTSVMLGPNAASRRESTASANGGGGGAADSSRDSATASLRRLSSNVDTSGKASTAGTGSATSTSSKRKRSTSLDDNDDDDGSIPPDDCSVPDDEGSLTSQWHNAAADLPHRQSMIRDIAHLLLARKQGNPGKRWLERLPLKARMLENHLYKSATSLEVYLDRSTLKRRLGHLASAITTHYRQATNSTTNPPTARGSSLDSTTMPSSHDTTFDSDLSTGATSDHNNGQKKQKSSALPTSKPAALPATSLQRQLSEAIPSSSSNGSFPDLRRQQSDSALSLANANPSLQSLPSSGIGSHALLSSNLNPGGNSKALQHQQNNNNGNNNFANGNSNNNNVNNGGNTLGVSTLAQHLQQQIFANIQQQEMFRRMSAGENTGNSSLLAGQQASNLLNRAGMNQMQQQQQQLHQQNASSLTSALAALQRQQQQQQQQGGQPQAGLLMGMASNNSMNMMNFNQSVIPRTMNSFALGANAGDSRRMPPPAGNLDINVNNPSPSATHTEDGVPLSPGSFRW